MLNRVYVLLATLLSLSGSFLMVALQQLMMAFAGIIVLPAAGPVGPTAADRPGAPSRAEPIMTSPGRLGRKEKE